MALPRANGNSYDVFLSFRGEDTRQTFTDHLYEALEQAGIHTFRDSDDAERGEDLKLEIVSAIKASDASIIVLSENYATSTWCLDEISLILDQRRDGNHFVLPLFYHVDPSDVGKHKKRFDIAANSSRRRWTVENVNRWKAALMEVVGVIGMCLVGPESQFIKEVVGTIYKRLDRKKIYIPPYVTGMDTRYKEVFSSWLEQSEDQFLVINGMPGSGKSTLAQYIVYSYGQHYESNSIVEKIGSRCKKMAILQQQLYNDISKGSDRRIHNVCQGTAHIEVLLEKTKALIVLDDVVKERQLEDLLGSGNLNKESKIIITTDNDLSNWFRSKSKRYHKHKMSLLDNNEALELLSLHAFQSKNPKDGYEELAQQVVEYCEGNPLALEVLGSSLSQKRSMAAWKSELRSFGKDFNGDIDVVLKSSYDSLTDSEKELFLHIACFFVGQDMDYVVNVLEPDYYAESKIKTLKKRCFLYVTPGKKLMMHRLLQEMGRSLVYRESPRILSKRSRVWRNKDSYEILRKKKGSETIEGLALDIKMLMIEEGLERRNLRELFSDSLQQMDKLKLLKLNYVELTGSYGDVSEHLRCLCWVGFNKSTIHTDLLMGKLVALDMSYSCLKVFEPPMVLGSLKILNLKDSHYLLEIRSIDQIPNLETLILWNCQSLFHVDSYIENLERLSVLNMTGCKNLCKKEPVHTSVQFNASTSGAGSTQRPSFPLPHFLHRLFLDECNLECTDRFPLSFNDQESLQYINLGNGLFEVLPSYNCLGNLRVLELRNCSRLKRLLCLPNALAELYISYCMSIEKITFESGRFTLQEFGYEGCFNLCEIEGLLKLLLVAKLDETDLGHMNWLKEYENHEVCLVGDYGLTEGRSCFLQMLYEYDIMSTSLPDIKHPNLVPEYATQSTSVSFNVPPCPISSHLQGLNVILRYKVSDEEDWTWFAKISMTNGDDLIYNPTVFGRPASGEVCIWLSYWPIGNLLNVGDEVTVSIFVMNGLEVVECGASLVYTDDDVASEISDNKLGWVETVERDLSEFKLRKGLYYLCRLDLYKLTELGRLTPGWLGTIVGDAIDDTEVRGWRMAGRPRQLYQSFTELKTIRCISQYPETIAEISSSSFADKTVEFRSSVSGKTTSSRARSDFSYTELQKEPVLKNKAFELPEHLKISLKDIILATQNFSDASIIGRGGFGIVYKGLLFLANGSKVMIAAKRLDRKYGQGENEFFTELKILLLGYKHENVIELVGVCDESDEKIIVYEYAPRGSLDRHLNNVDLTWMKRLQICIEVASGLEFFHGSQELVILGDIKSTNILLMEDWKAKLTDFGISVISSINKETDYAIHGVRGTNGYIDPQSMESGFITKESDIYSFGVVLLEIFSGKLAVQKIGEQFHTDVLKHHYENGRSDEMVFEGIKKQIVPSSLATFLAIAFQCLNEKREQRPTARDMVIQLKKALDLQVLSFNSHEERNELISATKFIYTNNSPHKWRSLTESRFHEVVEMLDISNMMIKIETKPQSLSPDVVYGVYLIFKFCELSVFSSKPIYVNLKYKMGDETLHSYFATKRDHEWMKIELYRFLNEKDNVEISFLIESLSEHYCGDDAIYVEGIEFRALKKVEHEYIDKVKEVHQVFKSNLITEDVQQILQTVNEKLFSLSEVNGKKHLMLSATTIFSSSSDSKFYESKPLAESRFHEVIELLPQVVFYIKCAVENHMLSSDTKYTCFLVFKLSKESQGMNGPVKVRDLLHRENKDPEIIYFTNPNPWNLNDVTRVPEEREDGWMEVRVSKFDLNRELDQDDCLLVNLKFKSYEGTMSGLSVSGLEFRPA